MNVRLLVLCPLFLFGASCTSTQETAPTPITPFDQPPAWAENAIWYQVFVERFRNGDPDNDQTLEDVVGSYPDNKPAHWGTVPWTHDWYAPAPWNDGEMEPSPEMQGRRYGGDIQGLIDQLDYLAELGINAIYLTPINDAPSLHKYDARNWRHVDRNFGPDPEGDRAIIEAENPRDPSTWQFTAADQLFLSFLDQAHGRGMRVIMDYSWNHTGIEFWAWKDILENQFASRYADWYEIESFDDPGTIRNEFEYRGWAGVSQLPELKKIDAPEERPVGIPFEGDLHPEVKEHVFAITKRWMDPNGDVDPSDGVDGFRLDVASEVPMGFWRDFRKLVRGINPDAYLVGEVWWEKWPDKMADPTPYLRGDVFDANMNYRWYMPVRSMILGAHPGVTVSSLEAHLDSIETGIRPENVRAMMNMAAGHDSPRFATSMKNAVPYKTQPPGYDLTKPDRSTIQRQKLLLIQMFTWHGAPHIWNGDEFGMWGGSDPHTRKPLIWPDMTFPPERYREDGTIGDPESVEVNEDLLAFYKSLIRMRKEHMELFVRGDIEYLVDEMPEGMLAYRRTLDGKEAVVVLNLTDAPDQVRVGEGFSHALSGENVVGDGVLVEAFTGVVLLR